MIVSIPEAAQRLNVSVDSIRRRVRSGALPANRDERGQWWLDLSNDGNGDLSEAEHLELGSCTPLQRTERDGLVCALEDQVDDLRARLDRSESERREQAEKFRSDLDRLLTMIERLSSGTGR
jgi:hypothetical protein